MRKKNMSTMNWEDAPDTITPQDLSKILGIGIVSARAIFERKDFPKISHEIIGNIGKADKIAARMYILGIKIKEQPKESLLYLMYLELQKLTRKEEF